ncbi:nuclear transport factor 2 family protein [Luteolibacter sp. SL250]|uniref:nuclear transport factor 2 family protein n=1 Tax=Luteolibacter sp. SL250 TaxID=2995170 RepID=UPI00226FE420|nr:nuclear transport factor 2 family protein [Luteolibacter sp. SL250]WAC18441.1 nuclear transport factor 2 family protein [Luteolibacter sp. SL250]
MKSIVIPFIAALVASFSFATAQPDTKEITAADDARVAATMAADKAGLEKAFSDGLHYAHSSGVVDTKASFIDTLVSGRNKYLKMDYIKREFSFPAPSVALMTGQVRIKTQSAEKGTNEFTLSFLGVWKQENSAWRFHAWQSARLPEPAKAN